MGSLTLADNVRAAWDHLGTGNRRAEVDRALSLTGMEARADRPGHALTLFERRMAEIARALVGRPRNPHGRARRRP